VTAPTFDCVIVQHETVAVHFCQHCRCKPLPASGTKAPVIGLEVVRSIYDIDDPKLASEFVAQLGIDLQDESCPPEIRRLGRTIIKWRHQIAAWHRAKFTNGPTRSRQQTDQEGKTRIAFGITNWTNYRTRSLLYAGKPNWSLLNLNSR
jgi:hypothetical protein